MNFNEFTFEKFFENSDFERYESPELMRSYNKLNALLDSNIPDTEIRNKTDHVLGECYLLAIDSGFEHGFRFAVNLIKFMYKV